jgi:hypothetical protein
MKTNQSENMAVYSSDTMLAFIDILGFKKMLEEKPLNKILEIINSILHFDNSADYS